MIESMAKQYVQLTDFLGRVLGSDYQIVLREVEDGQSRVLAEANSPARANGGDAPTTSPENCYHVGSGDAVRHFYVQENGKRLRCSTLLLQAGEGAPAVELCIKFDESRYQDLCRRIQDICTPAGFIVSDDAPDADGGSAAPENLRDSMAAISDKVITEVMSENVVPVSRLNMDEKMDIIRKLNDRGVFLFKGAVKQVATQLECSQASVYRYLSKLETPSNPME